MATYVLEAGAPEAASESVAGGKGASLARLAALGFAVPRFFIIPVDVFRQLETSMGDFPAEFTDALRAAYESVGGDSIRLAVRSSAVGEDSLEGSFAGLYHTSLGVSGFAGLLDGIRQCWASYRVDHAEQYRARLGESDAGGMGIVVQQFVEGDWSGVTFTANPVTSALSEMVVNVVPGSGEKLVSGAVNPEEISLRVPGGSVVKRSGGGSARVPESVIRAVFEHCGRVHEATGFPQDVEWTVQGADVFLLQSRPITTVTAVFINRALEPWKDEPDYAETADVVWTRAYGDEVWTSPESPLFYSIRNPPGPGRGWFGSYLQAHGDERPMPPAVAKYFKAAAYADVDVLKRMYEYHPKFARIAGVLNFFPAGTRDGVRDARWRWKGRLKRHWLLEYKERKTQSLAYNHRYLESLWPEFVATSDRWFDLDLDSLSMEELRAHQAEVFPEMGKVGLPCAVGVMYHSFDLTFVLTGLLEKWCGDGDVLYAEVSGGLDDSDTVAEAEGIWRLARVAKEGGPDVLHAVMDGKWLSLQERAEEDGSLQPFVRQFSSFLRDHRHRGGSYKDVVYPRWGDDPDLLLNLVKTFVTSTSVSPAEQNRVQSEARRRQQKAVLKRVRGIGAPLKRSALRWLFRYNEIYMAIRNNHRFYFDRVWYALRRVYLSLGGRLVAQGILTDREDVFFLGAMEVELALSGQLSLPEATLRISVRKKEWEETLQRQAPKFLCGYQPFEDSGDDGAPGAAIAGIAASPGRSTATARVIYRIEDLPRVEDGDILVTRQTDPGWTPVFSKISGLVLETGGVLAHGTSLSREYGLPCVTAVENATGRISDGEVVTIDGSAGKVIRAIGT